MKVSVVRGGGLGGMVRFVEADTERLSPDDAQRLQSLVQDARLVGENTGAEPQDGHPDEFTYELAVEETAGAGRFRFSEGSVPPGVQALISFVRSVEGRTESVLRPGR